MENTKSTKGRRFLSVALTLVMAMSLSAVMPLEARAASGTLVFTAFDADLINGDHTTITRIVGEKNFTLTGGTVGEGLMYDGGGILADEGLTGVKLTIEIENGCMFDLDALDAMATSNNVSANVWYANGETGSFTLNGISNSGLTQIDYFGGSNDDTISHIRKLELSSSDDAVFQNIALVNIKEIPLLPVATTQGGTSIAATSVTLNGSVNAQGDSTTVVFEYGQTVAYGSSANASESPLDTSIVESISRSITGLEPNTTYHYRVKATNAAGTDYSADASFTTLIAPPSAPTIETATAGNAQASVSFIPPASNGGGAISGYIVTSSPGGLTGTGEVSPIIVTGLTNGTAYTFTVTAANSAGPGTASTASNSVTPKAPQTITFGNPGAQNFGTTPTLVATSDSGLTPTFTSSTPGVCTITSDGILTFISAGSATINADQPGDASYLPAPTATQTFTVNAVAPGAPTAVTATEGDTQASVSFTAPASTGGTTITSYTVTVNPADVAPVNGSESPIMVTGLTNGQAYTFTVTANNVAGPGPGSSASNSVTPRAIQTITFANPGAQNFGTTPTLTATTDSGLNPTFTSSTPLVCTITGGGVLTFISAGTATINADQAGNASYLPATQVSRTFTVNAVAPGAPTGVTATVSDTTASVSFTAPVSNGGAAITGYTVTSSPGGLTGSGATSPITVSGLTPGHAYTFTVKATNSAATGAASVASNSVTLKAPQTIIFTNPGDQNFGTTPTLWAMASSGLDVTFTSTTPSVCTITHDGVLTFVGTGTATIIAEQAGDSDYLPATAASQSFEVNPVVPGAPTIGTATAGNGQATVSFTAPVSNGGATITGYTVTSNPGGKTATGSTSPITVTGLTNGTAYTFTVAATNSVDTGAPSAQSNSITPIAPSTGGGGGGGSSSSTTAQTYKAEVKVENGNATLPVVIDKNTGSASVDASAQSNVMSEGKSAVITVPSIPNVDSYTIGIPVPNLSATDTLGSLTIHAEKGTITVPSNMLAGVAGEGGNKAQITIGEGDKGSLPDDVKAVIGDRPLIQLTLSVDGNQTHWNNPAAPVTVAIPYKPTAAELKNPEGIVVWYIDGKGNVVTIPNGRYDGATGKVTFATTHFSDYAVAYNPVSFNDVAADAWYHKAVTFIAARGITTGTGDGNFSPQAKLTRGEFIVLMMKAYGIAPDTNAKDNFADGGNTYYTGYLAKAKQLEITSGIGNNMYAPNKEITRQEMFTLLYNALKAIDQLPQGNAGKALSDFTDGEQIDKWAVDAMTFFVKTNTVGGNGGKLTPTGTTTRGEMVQVLYNLLGK